MGQVWTACVLLVAVLGVGLPVAARLGERLQLPVTTRAGLAPLVGLTYVGVVTLALGHLDLLGAWLPYGLGGAAVVVVVLDRSSARRLVAAAWVGTRSQARRFPVQVLAVGVAFALAVWAAGAPPFRTDEVQYHWPAPVAWAAAGGWDASPYRHVNGFPFMEVIYTAAATQGSYVAAHLLDLLTLLALGLAAAGAARSLGVTGTGAVVTAAMVMPVAWGPAYAAYNDTPVGAFGAAAAAVVLGSSRARAGGTALACALLMVAISIKPTGAGAVGLVGLVMLLLAVLLRDETLRPASRLLKHWLALAVSAAAALAFWSVRQWVFTGHLVDPGLTAPPSADALTRVPDTMEKVIAPFMPLVTGIVGNQEPWGGRTSLVVQIFLVPALVYVIWARGGVLRRFTVLALPAWAHWVVLGLASVRTRFHIVSWALMVASVRVAVEDASGRFPRLARWLELAWTLGVLLGVLDVSRAMVQLIRATWF